MYNDGRAGFIPEVFKNMFKNFIYFLTNISLENFLII